MKKTDFFNSFEYEYTTDQYNIIKEIYKDMEQDLPMDKLLCWDVWFWKTEIAFASIYAESSKYYNFIPMWFILITIIIINFYTFTNEYNAQK